MNSLSFKAGKKKQVTSTELASSSIKNYLARKQHYGETKENSNLDISTTTSNHHHQQQLLIHTSPHEHVLLLFFHFLSLKSCAVVDQAALLQALSATTRDDYSSSSCFFFYCRFSLASLLACCCRPLTKGLASDCLHNNKSNTDADPSTYLSFFQPKADATGLYTKNPSLVLQQQHPSLPDPEVLSAVFFFPGAKFRQNAKNKDKMGIFSRTIPISRNFRGFLFF
jgi:hypothetical protein